MGILNVLAIMFCIAVFMLCIMVAFIVGYTIGTDGTLKPKKEKPPPVISAERKCELDKAKKEYENFMNYDGAEQN